MAIITRLEPRTIQVTTGEGKGLQGVVLYFDTINEADRIETRLKWSEDPMAYAEKLRKVQQKGC